MKTDEGINLPNHSVVCTTCLCFIKDIEAEDLTPIQENPTIYKLTCPVCNESNYVSGKYWDKLYEDAKIKAAFPPLPSVDEKRFNAKLNNYIWQNKGKLTEMSKAEFNLFENAIAKMLKELKAKETQTSEKILETKMKSLNLFDTINAIKCKAGNLIEQKDLEKAHKKFDEFHASVRQKIEEHSAVQGELNALETLLANIQGRIEDLYDNKSTVNMWRNGR